MSYEVFLSRGGSGGSGGRVAACLPGWMDAHKLGRELV